MINRRIIQKKKNIHYDLMWCLQAFKLISTRTARPETTTCPVHTDISSVKGADNPPATASTVPFMAGLSLWQKELNRNLYSHWSNVYGCDGAVK